VRLRDRGVVGCRRRVYSAAERQVFAGFRLRDYIAAERQECSGMRTECLYCG
jgi:hypothetical protein